jgi:hypothetical protein
MSAMVSAGRYREGSSSPALNSSFQSIKKEGGSRSSHMQAIIYRISISGFPNSNNTCCPIDNVTSTWTAHRSDRDRLTICERVSRNRPRPIAVLNWALPLSFSNCVAPAICAFQDWIDCLLSQTRFYDQSQRASRKVHSEDILRKNSAWKLQ